MGKVDKPTSTYLVITEVKGLILGVRKMQNRGRVQIPKKVREKLKMKEGDSVYWVEHENMICVTKAVKI